MSVKLLFSEYFEVDENVLDEHGALNIMYRCGSPVIYRSIFIIRFRKSGIC
jgi:hypothetical protein